MLKKRSISDIPEETEESGWVWNSRDKSKSSVATLLSNHSFLERSRRVHFLCKSLSRLLPPCLITSFLTCLKAIFVCQSCKAAFTKLVILYTVIWSACSFSPQVIQRFIDQTSQRGLESKFYALSAQGSFPSKKMLWKQKNLKTASRSCVRLKHWIAHKFQISYFMALMSYLFPNENKQTKPNNFKMSKTKQIAPKYPQPQPNKYFPCLNKIPKKFLDISKGQPFSPELITLRAFPFSPTVFSILFFHVLHPVWSSLLASSGSKP